MLHLKNKENIQLSMLAIPIIISGLAAKSFSVAFCILSVVLLLLLVTLMPLFHKHETIWAFLVTFISTIPINIKIITVSTLINDFYFYKLIFKVFGYPLFYIILLCLEEIIICAISAVLAKTKSDILNKISKT